MNQEDAIRAALEEFGMVTRDTYGTISVRHDIEIPVIKANIPRPWSIVDTAWLEDPAKVIAKYEGTYAQCRVMRGKSLFSMILLKLRHEV